MVEKMMIDWQRANDLRAEIGCEGFAEVVELFLDEVEGVVLRLKTRPEPARYEADLHFLKGGAWNLGFAEFGALCQDGERKAAAAYTSQINISPTVKAYSTPAAPFLARI